MKIINLTPHAITILREGDAMTIASSGLARCQSTTSTVDTVDGIPVNRTVMGAVEGLPAPQQDTIYIVSRVVAEAVRGSRHDVFIVDKTVRNENGQIIGCQALAII